MGLKILHSADWHLDSPFGSFPEAQRSALQKAQRRIPGMIADLCRRESCDLMLLAGDIFDGTPTRESLELLKRALKESGVPVFVAPGNHDFCAPGSSWLETCWPENVHVFTGALTWVTIPELDCRIYGAGYRSMDCPGLLEGFRAQGNERYTIALLHGDPARKTSAYCPITAAQVRDSGLDYLALGHIHKAGAFRAGDTLCAWPGCPMGRGWDETGEKGVAIVTLTDTAQLRMAALDTPKFFEMEADVENDVLQQLQALLPATGGEDFYRITLSGRGSVDIAGLKRRFSAFANLELIDRTEEPVDLWAEAGEDTLRGVYFRLLQQAARSDEKNADRIRLAAEISRKLLEGREVILP